MSKFTLMFEDIMLPDGAPGVAVRSIYDPPVPAGGEPTQAQMLGNMALELYRKWMEENDLPEVLNIRKGDLQ